MSIDYLIFMIPAFLLTLFTSWYVKAAYRKWSQVPTRSGLNGYQAAQRLIVAGGLSNVSVEGVGGNLTDHYDPRSNVLRLSQSVAQSPSVASIAVAAHELGHAQQDAQGYFPLRLRSALVPMANIGSSLGWILIMIGMFLAYAGMSLGTDVAWLGVMVFSGGALFALATLPVELNASSRARRLLVETGIVSDPEEERGVKNMLNAAALTYIAALVTAVLQVIYFVSLVGGLGRRRR